METKQRKEIQIQLMFWIVFISAFLIATQKHALAKGPQGETSRTTTSSAPASAAKNCPKTMLSWAQDQNHSYSFSGLYKSIGSILTAPFNLSPAEACELNTQYNLKSSTTLDLRHRFAQSSIGKRLSTENNQLAPQCELSDVENKTLTQKYYLAQATLENELQLVQNELLVEQEFGEHLFRGNDELKMSCDTPGFIAVASRCQREIKNCGLDSQKKYDALAAQIESQLDRISEIRRELHQMEKYLGGGFGAVPVKTVAPENQAKYDLLKIELNAIYATQPYFKGTEFKSLLERSDWRKTAATKKAAVAAALTAQLKKDRKALLERKNRALKISQCLQGKKQDCSVAEINSVLAASRVPTITESNRTDRAAQRQILDQCLNQGLARREARLEEAGVIGSLAVSGGFGFAARTAAFAAFRNAVGVGGMQLAGVGVGAAVVTDSVKQAVLKCNQSQVDLSSQSTNPQAVNVCANAETIAGVHVADWLGCVAKSAGVDVAGVALAGIGGATVAARRLALAELRASKSGQKLIKEFGEDRALALSRAAQLSPDARIAEAEKLLGRKLSADQRAQLLRAHEVGAGQIGRDGTAAGYGNYTPAQLREKDEALISAGVMDFKQRKALMREGIVGGVPRDTSYATRMEARARAADFEFKSANEVQGKITDLNLRIENLRDELGLNRTGFGSRAPELTDEARAAKLSQLKEFEEEKLALTEKLQGAASNTEFYTQSRIGDTSRRLQRASEEDKDALLLERSSLHGSLGFDQAAGKNFGAARQAFRDAAQDMETITDISKLNSQQQMDALRSMRLGSPHPTDIDNYNRLVERLASSSRIEARDFEDIRFPPRANVTALNTVRGSAWETYERYQQHLLREDVMDQSFRFVRDSAGRNWLPTRKNPELQYLTDRFQNYQQQGEALRREFLQQLRRESRSVSDFERAAQSLGIENPHI